MTSDEYAKQLTQTTTELRRHRKGVRRAQVRLKRLHQEARQTGIEVPPAAQGQKQ